MALVDAGPAPMLNMLRRKARRVVEHSPSKCGGLSSLFTTHSLRGDAFSQQHTEPLDRHFEDLRHGPLSLLNGHLVAHTAGEVGVSKCNPAK